MQRIALLESEKHIAGSGNGSAASIALHAVVLAFAIAVTSHAGRRDKPSAIYVPLPRFQPEVRMVTQRVAPHAPAAVPRVPAIAVAVPTVIPASISVPMVSAITPAVIGASTAAIPGVSAGSNTPSVTVRGDVPFDAGEVDVAASVLPGQRGPSYPEGLRMLRIEGRVVARFVIGKNGRVESDPTIVSSSAEEFSAAVRRYLSTARYRPATVGGDPVRQLAEQEFDFSVRR
ncbi:MAG: TonB family protein [Gemmatimonadota bacterium]|nr:TonB family protein [Gemmatimonadota bacterium]